MKLTLRKDTAKRIAARLLLDASELELRHRTPAAGEHFSVRPVVIEREIARLRRWAHQLRKASAQEENSEEARAEWEGYESSEKALAHNGRTYRPGRPTARRERNI